MPFLNEPGPGEFHLSERTCAIILLVLLALGLTSMIVGIVW